MTRPAWSDVCAGKFELSPLGDLSSLPQRQTEWRTKFASGFYGPIPAPPTSLDVTSHEVPGDRATRIRLRVNEGFKVDAALWRPLHNRPAPLICGLSFTGPIGVLGGTSFPIDPDARVYSRPELGAPDNRLHDILRGTEAHRWPIDTLTSAGFAVLISCYGSWAPDEPASFARHGLRPVLHTETGAISLWAWAIIRLLDAAERVPGIITTDAIVAGHSRLGKAALWAAANDMRIGTVFANEAGCGGTAPAAHKIGETVNQMKEAFPHWLCNRDPSFDLDQHHLMATIAPRQLYIASAEEDVWADPIGTYTALTAASAAWNENANWPMPKDMWHSHGPTHFARLGHHLRPGKHELLPEDWDNFLKFLGK